MTPIHPPKGNSLIIILLLLVIISAAAILLFSKFQLTPKNPVSMPPPASSPAPDPTTNWKIYTSSKYKYSFKYPPTWTLSEEENNNENMSVVSLTGEGFSGTSQYQANNLLVRVLPAKKQPNGKVCFPRKSSSECYPISQTQSVNVDNVSGYLTDYSIPEPGGTSNDSKVRLVLVEDNGYIYSISQQRIVSEEENFLSIFDRILSTFKFLDQPTSTPTATAIPGIKLQSTAGWTEVGNTTFSIQIPTDIFEYTTDAKFIQLKRKGQSDSGPSFLIADNYTGGSRREWFLASYSYYPSEVGKNIFFKEVLLGSVNAILVTTPESTSPTNILVARGKTLINILVQDKDANLVSTISSTIKFK